MTKTQVFLAKKISPTMKVWKITKEEKLPTWATHDAKGSYHGRCYWTGDDIYELNHLTVSAPRKFGGWQIADQGDYLLFNPANEDGDEIWAESKEYFEENYILVRTNDL